MKKFMFTLALSALVTMGVQAQKQMGDEHNIEVAFTPFGGSPIDGSTIKYRNFVDDNRAFRLSLTIGNSTDLYAYRQDGEVLPADPVSPQLNITSKSSTFGIAPGYELHFDGMDNLSPYIAFELPITLSKREDTKEYWGAQEVAHLAGNNNEATDSFDQFVVWNLTNTQGSTRVGLNMMFGADYYFSDAIYLGFEAGIGFGRTTWGNHSITTDNTTAFNIEFNEAFESDEAGAEIQGEFVGQLDFDATEFTAIELDGLPIGTIEGLIYDEYFERDGDGNIPATTYYTGPNHISNTTFGNVFQGALRIGFLFD